MIKRTVVGVLGAFLIGMSIFFNQMYPLVLNVVISVFSVFSIYELLSSVSAIKRYYLTVPTFLFSLTPLFVDEILIQVSFYVYTMLIFFVMLLFNDGAKLKDIAVVYTVSSVIVLSLSLFIMTRNRMGQYGTFFVVLIFVTAWMTDTGAYFFGSFLGKHRLCPSISPKKTVEGAIGGVVVSFVSLFFVCFIFKNYVYTKDIYINYYVIVFLGTLGSIISMLGDLSFSFIKRSCNIKDFGNIIPGHGGVLDRIDSVIFVAPLVYFISLLFSVIYYI